MVELTQAIRSQKNNKTPGLDGLSGEYYKTMEEILSPIMLDLYNEVLTDSNMPDTWKDALISLILKDGTDARQIHNYRPISLLNSDYKIFATIIANRRKNLLNDYIHGDQNGFLPG
uniref:Reverse transcriptase domain-containing protein n=1 Tax=Micrurus corallinus TaxID=54390 RepID=A0A2D4EPZ4_MICCO